MKDIPTYNQPPLCVTLPLERIISFPGYCDLFEQYLGLDGQTAYDIIMDLVGLTIKFPDEFLIFNWVTITEDLESPELLRLTTDGNISIILATELLDDDSNTRTNIITNIGELNNSTSMMNTIIKVLEEYDPSLRDNINLNTMPMPTNNYLISPDGTMQGDFTLVDNPDKLYGFVISDASGKGKDVIVEVFEK